MTNLSLKHLGIHEELMGMWVSSFYDPPIYGIIIIFFFNKSLFIPYMRCGFISHIGEKHKLMAKKRGQNR
jgi:hypothetical protein